MSDPDAPFAADDILGSRWIPDSTAHEFAVRLPDGGQGRAVAGNLTAKIGDEDVAAALNLQVEGHGRDAVEEQLAHADGLGIDPSFFASRSDR